MAWRAVAEPWLGRCPPAGRTMTRTLGTMATVAERLTADEYLAREDPRRTELVDGVLVVNEPTVLHQRVVGLIYAALLAWRQGAPERGTVSLPLDVRLDDSTVLAPDVLWFAGEIDLAAPRAPRMPELAVEVRSPATWVYDVGQKRDLYERHGLRELWLADTASRTLLVYRRDQDRGGFDVQVELTAAERLRSPLLPDFAIAVGDLMPTLG
jgi:Uma2 family endonuclease